jgi:hypothetical protein
MIERVNAAKRTRKLYNDYQRHLASKEHAKVREEVTGALKNLVVPKFTLNVRERVFQHKALTMLLAKGTITYAVIRLLSGWWHSGFNVYCGPRTMSFLLVPIRLPHLVL